MIRKSYKVADGSKITDNLTVAKMIKKGAEDIESILKKRPILENATLCHKIASPLSWDALEMADSEMTTWCVEKGAKNLKEWFENYQYKASFVRKNLCDSMIEVWEAGGVRESINKIVKSLCYALYGKVPERLDFAGVLAFTLFGNFELSLPNIPMEKFFEKKILPIRLCNKALVRRFVPFFSREYVYSSFENSKYSSYVKICSMYEMHFMKREYNGKMLSEYVNSVIQNVSREQIYSQLCAILNVKEEGESDMKFLGEYKITVENGQIKLPESWSLDGEVVLIGCGDHIEIIKKEDYEKALDSVF